MGARRALGRWSWRLVRREWREQLLIFGLIGVSIALASVVATMVYHAAAQRSSFRGEATHEITVGGDVEIARQALNESFPSAEVTVATFDSLAGTPLAFRIQSTPPPSSLGAETVRLVEGQYPNGPTEIALSTSLATASRVGLGDSILLTSGEYTIVALVEDPNALWSDFGVVAEVDEPSEAVALVRASQAEVGRFVDSVNGGGPESGQYASSDQLDAGRERRVALAVMIGLVGIAMLEIALLCSAGFVVLGQRRIRQFGLLSAVGATPRHLRQAMKLNGLFLGLAGGAAGVTVGFLASLAARPLLESILGQRIEAWDVPWSALLPLVGVSALTGLIAAWWPARGLARIPIVAALTSRPPVTRSTIGWAAAGAIVFAAGSATLVFASSTGRGSLAAVAMIVAVIGLLAMTPPLTALAGRLAPHLPLAPRIALRDLSRHPRRSAAALASLVVAVGIPLGIVLTSASADANLDNGGENLPDNWAIVMPEQSRFDSQIRESTDPRFASMPEAIRKILPLAVSIPIELATPSEPITTRSHPDFVEAVSPILSVSFDPDDQSFFSQGVTGPSWVATPAILEALGLDPSLADSSAPVLAESSGPIHLGYWTVVANPETGEISGQVTPEVTELSPYRSVPDYLIPEASLEGQGLRAVKAGWLVTNPDPITDQDNERLIAAITTEAAGGAGTVADPWVVETRQPNQDDGQFRWVVLGIGAAIAAAIIASMVSLLRVDSSGDDRTLAAVGAPSGIRRTIVASSTAFLSFGGALLALPAGYLGLVAIMSDRGAGYPLVFPILELSALLIGLPLAATGVAWLLVRGQPGHLTRSSNIT